MVESTNLSSQTTIQVHDLSFTYNKASSPAVDGLSFEIKPGEVFGFLGPSGAGKSTTQKILIGLLDDYRGSRIGGSFPVLAV